MILDASGNPIESAAEPKAENDGYENIPSMNFPPITPKPEWFDRKLIELGGYVPGTEIPKYRVVWGMDEKQFAMGELHMKYISIIDTIQTTLGYNIIDIKNKKRKPRFMKPQEAHARYMDPLSKQMTRNKEDNVFIVPVVKEETREIGMPLWVAEYYLEPEGFGTPEGWQANRYLTHPEDPRKSIDAIGPYPSKGAYVEWFMIYGLDEEGRTIYQELDDNAFEMFRANHVLNEARRKNMVYDTIEKRQEKRDDKFESDWAEFDRELTTEILDVKKNRHFNVTPKG